MTSIDQTPARGQRPLSMDGEGPFRQGRTGAGGWPEGLPVWVHSGRPLPRPDDARGDVDGFVFHAFAWGDRDLSDHLPQAVPDRQGSFLAPDPAGADAGTVAIQDELRAVDAVDP